MLRPDLAPIDVLLSDALLYAESEFLVKHPHPMLVLPEPDWAALARQLPAETALPGRKLPGIYAMVDPQARRSSGASLDALCLPLRPRFTASYDRMTLGRDEEADVVLIDETVSKLHAELSWNAERGRAVLTDLGSRNGTFVDGLRLAARGHAELLPGAVIAFGSLAGRFYTPRAFLAWMLGGMARAGAAPTRLD